MPKQINLFGVETDYDELQKTLEATLRKTIKDKHYEQYGYTQGETCKNCIHLERHLWRSKCYYKCPKLGISNSPATDIRLKQPACGLWEEEYVDD